MSIDTLRHASTTVRYPENWCATGGECRPTQDSSSTSESRWRSRFRHGRQPKDGNRKYEPVVEFIKHKSLQEMDALLCAEMMDLGAEEKAQVSEYNSYESLIKLWANKRALTPAAMQYYAARYVLPWHLSESEQKVCSSQTQLAPK